MPLSLSRRLLPALALLLAMPGIARADLAQPSGEVLLTVTGAISVANADGDAVFDRAMLESLPQVSFETATIWTDGVHEFTGVPLVDLLAAVGANGSTLTAVALNDYSVDIPVSDAVAGGPIVAYMVDGAPMTVRNKGPLWIVYPYDLEPDYQSEVIFSRSIWQLVRIDVTE